MKRAALGSRMVFFLCFECDRRQSHAGACEECGGSMETLSAIACKECITPIETTEGDGSQ